MSSDKNNNKPLVVTYRTHHHAHDDKSAEIIYIPPPSEGSLFQLWYSLVQHVYGVIILHYFFWWVPMLIFLSIVYFFYSPLVALVLTLGYSYTYFKRDEFTGKRTSDFVRKSWLWKTLQNYHHLEVVREVELDPQKKYIFAYHPHGIMILSRALTYGGLWETLFPGIVHRCLAATPLFNIPGCRDIALWTGCIRADKSNALRILNSQDNDGSNKSLCVYPGGSAEIFHTNPFTKEITLVGRKGFIRLALQTGSYLVPAFVFGEKYAYNNSPLPGFIQNFFMKKMRTPLTLFWGKWRTWLPLQDKRYYLSVVFGQPIPVERIAEPSEKQVDELCQLYYQEISNIFKWYKNVYGHECDFLTIKMAGK